MFETVCIIHILCLFCRKMCIKSEKRFDFLKELVSTVPDLQGDHDEPLALYQNMTGETQEGKKDTSNASQRPKLPRQLSTPRPRYMLILICTISLNYRTEFAHWWSM